MKKILVFAGLLFSFLISAQDRPGPQPAPETNEKFNVGMAGYSFRHFNLDQTLEMMQKCDVKYLCIKDFHLPLTSNEKEIAEFHNKLNSKGVTGYAVGPIYMRSEKEIGYTDAQLQLMSENDMLYAIHLHGPDMELYPDADDVWDNVKELDPRIGMCLDVGHDTRNGKDPVADLKKYHSRVFDIHIKDVTDASKAGYSVEIGRGIINFPAFVKMLREVGYTGMCSLEHERNMKDPLQGIAESLGYFRGVITATNK